MIIRHMEPTADKSNRRTVVIAEAARLKELWNAATNRPSQAEFGETFNIGGQSAVGNFLSGASPLSLKAASGFARGLGVPIEAFSPRLAEEARAVAKSLNSAESGQDNQAPSPRPPINQFASEGGPSKRKYLVAVHDPDTEEQIGMILLEAESLSDAHDRGLRLIQQHQTSKSIDIQRFATAVFQVHSLSPARWD